jgi:cytohesin
MPLWTAAYHGHADVVRILLSHGADRSLKSREGKTALDYAEAQCRAEVAALLLNP